MRLEYLDESSEFTAKQLEWLKSRQLVQITRIEPFDATKLMEVDLDKIPSTRLRQLIEEVRNEDPSGPTPYNRWHNRHNRSR